MQKIVTLIVLSLVLLVGGLAACSSGGGSDDGASDVGSKDIPTAVIVEEEPETEAVTTQIADAEPVAEPEPEIPELYLEVTSPLNESVVKNSSLKVTGSTIPTAIVSVNGVLASVDAEGAFSATTTLDTGANFIEVVTSNFAGEEVGEVLTVVYLPS